MIVYRKYDLKGKFIKEYLSINEASADTNVCSTSIRRCLAGERLTAGNHFWRRELKADKPMASIELEELVQHRKNSEKFIATRPVKKIDVNTGKVVASFPSITSAAKYTEIDKKCIFDVLRGVQKTAGGYAWIESKD